MVVIILAVAFVIAGVLLWLGNQRFAKVRLMRATPTTPMIQLQSGLREVKGTVSALSEALTSPMKGASCVYYRFHVQERVKRGKNTKWVTRIDDRDHRLCLVEDETGAVELDLTAADLHLDADSHERSGFLDDATPELEELLARYGHKSTALIFNRTLKYEETVLEVGDTVYALGECVMRENSFPAFTKGPDGIFIVSDRSEERVGQKFVLAGVGFGVAALMVLILGGIMAVAFL